MLPEPKFIPCTREIEIAGGVRYRPVRSWHSGVLAGERLTEQNGDRSGCVWTEDGRQVTLPPRSVVHRLYWHPSDPSRTISAFLSYPGGMGIPLEYFWEAQIGGEIERFTGPRAEEECEAAIVRSLVGD